jgi:hypothetical protein
MHLQTTITADVLERSTGKVGAFDEVLARLKAAQ